MSKHNSGYINNSLTYGFTESSGVWTVRRQKSTMYDRVDKEFRWDTSSGR